jgi:hypothetical protein
MTHPQEQRRKHAIARYRAGEKIDVICRDLHCSKSWLYRVSVLGGTLRRLNHLPRWPDDVAWA